MRIVQELSSARSFVPIGAWAPVVAVGLAIAMSSPAQSQTVSEPVYAVTYLDVGANSLGRGVDLLKQYRESSRREAANVEFTVLQETDRPNRFAIVEGWKDQSAFDAHQNAASTAQFEETLKAIRNSPPNQHVLQAFATGSARAERPSDALYMLEHIDFLPMFANLAQPAVRRLAKRARRRKVHCATTSTRSPPRIANHFSVVAVWATPKAFDAYETAAPTREFRAATVMPARGNLYDQRLYKVVD